MIRRCNIAIYYRLLIYSNLVIGSKVLDENGFCIVNDGWNDLFSISSHTTKYHRIFRQLKVVQKIRAGSRPEFHVNFGSRWVTSLVGRFGSSQENWTHVQLWIIMLTRQTLSKNARLSLGKHCQTTTQRVWPRSLLSNWQHQFNLKDKIDCRIRWKIYQNLSMLYWAPTSAWHILTSSQFLYLTYSFFVHSVQNVPKPTHKWSDVTRPDPLTWNSGPDPARPIFVHFYLTYSFCTFCAFSPTCRRFCCQLSEQFVHWKDRSPQRPMCRVGSYLT